ncbi:DUF3306 domain-containing protein [Shewanella inventionis]|uniref:DUF3306 domain-containing protein n=1 Tax=Shewanella inventionis TaxID=1738770 RepID=A0ABQ1JRV4_9GAMM|nr:DUF3306 domain-containing protein [Shewanella inventionis]MCL1159493.1 DUF3306 domain-containing protein [Shewanella inventionis]UAL43768.1 DUF3306 domain-containing protein [Shewanella inventionis]GGB73050.1 hypothetical protein GCM10011607_36880 [Shewanella inventionis]
MSGQDGLLSRWELRRQRVAAEAEQQALDTKDSESLELVSEATEPAELDDTLPDVSPEEEPLPDPTTIEVGGSFARFMAKNVDPTTKAAALRALWKQPQYGHIDGLLEYALDYSNQPILSADVSAELAGKVFRYVVEKTKITEDELLADSEAEMASDEAVATQINSETESTEVDESLVITQQSETLSANAQVQDDDLLEQAFASDEAKG